MMKNAIKECLTSVLVEADSVSAGYLFPESFIGFQGHFPGQPVLPGVCLIQAALVAAEKLSEVPLKLETIINAKFFASVLPGREIQIKCSLTKGRVKALVMTGGERICVLKLDCREIGVGNDQR